MIDWNEPSVSKKVFISDLRKSNMQVILVKVWPCSDVQPQAAEEVKVLSADYPFAVGTESAVKT